MNQNKKQTPNSMGSLELGKVQPQAVELEEAVLGALMLEKEAFAVVENLLQVDDFYNPIHQVVFKAISELSAQRNPIDILTVVEQLKRMGELENVGGPVYVSQLTDKIASSAHLEYHARIIKQKAQARFMIALASKITTLSFDETQDVDETMEVLEQALSNMNSSNVGTQSIDMKAAIKAAIDKASQTQVDKESGKIVAIPTGLFNLDNEFAGGWRSPDLIVVGGRPSMGKTQHALSFTKAAAKAGKHCCFISIEMNATQLVNRFLLEDDRINNYNLRTGQMSSEEWNALDYKASEFFNLPIHIADHHSIRYLNNIKSEARRLHRRGQLDLLIIDYLGLIRTNMKFQSRYLEIGYITGELKNLAKELNIPIILLSQLSRPRKDIAVKAPQMEDLRESGDIEQDADIILFIHKPDYYDPNAMDEATNTPWKGKGMLIISKYREGARNNFVTFCHDERYKKITDNAQPSYTNANPDRHIEPRKGEGTPF